MIFRAEGLETIFGDLCARADDGELYLEKRAQGSFVWDQGKMRDASLSQTEGFGIRAVQGGGVYFTHGPTLKPKALQEGALSLLSGLRNHTPRISPPPVALAQTALPPIKSAAAFDRVTTLMKHLDEAARSLDPRVQNVTIQISFVHQEVGLFRFEDAQTPFSDRRTYALCALTLLVQEGTLLETGSASFGKSFDFESLLAQEPALMALPQEALRKGRLLLSAAPAPSGNFPVLLGAGSPAILLHEAIGHGFEGDAHHKGQSAFCGKMGQKVAAPCVTVVDSPLLGGDLPGNLRLDDEGTPGQATTLIQEGVMVGCMHDRLSARLLATKPTGNGRRESYAHAPLPRMTNTVLQPGAASFEEMLCGIDRGVFAANFSSGQVDIVSGNFVFSTNEAYWVEKGRIVSPLKNVTLTGSGTEVMKNILAVGSDLAHAPGLGYCIKDGQTVIVGLGQPPALVSSLLVGGQDSTAGA